MNPEKSQNLDLPVPELITPKESRFHSLRESFREVFGPRKIVRFKGGPHQGPTFKAPDLRVNFGSWDESFLWSLKQLFRPDKLPALPPSALKVKLEDTWIVSDQERRKRVQALSLLVHSTILLLVAIPFVRNVVQAQPPEITEAEPFNIALNLPVAAKELRGGGGGGNRNPLPATRGRLPKFSLEHQLVAPSVTLNNPDPKLVAEPTLLMPPQVKIDNPNLANLGDPLSESALLSNGIGAGGGIGSGLGGGIGSGFGPGFGPGQGGAMGGGVFEVGGGVSEPVCLDCPDPEYSEEARKAKYQGTVVLLAIVDETGRARSIRLVKSLGLGLDEEAMRAVQNWIFRPAVFKGNAVPVRIYIEVDFNIF